MCRLMHSTQRKLNTKDNSDEYTGSDHRNDEIHAGESQQEIGKGDEGSESDEGRKGPHVEEHALRSKAEKVLDLLKRKEGATLPEIAKATDWQNHSIRGFVSGHVTKKLGLIVESTKSEAGERTYRILN